MTENQKLAAIADFLDDQGVTAGFDIIGNMIVIIPSSSASRGYLKGLLKQNKDNFLIPIEQMYSIVTSEIRKEKIERILK